MANKEKGSGKATGFFGKIGAFWNSRSVRVARKLVGGVCKCLFTILLIGVITFTIVAAVMTVYVVTNFNGSDGVPDLNDLSVNETTIIYTKTADGGWAESKRLDGVDSIWVDLEDIPLNMQHAVVAIEDKRFYQHDGVDWRRTIGASLNLVLHSRSVFGGSTITQQLIKVSTGDDDQTIDRKITEIMRATYLEKSLDGSKADVKEQILETYLNILPLSGQIAGVGAAANSYFGKDISELSLAECAAIASITQNPSKYNPYIHPENLRTRQRTVLYEMLDQGWITKDEYLQAINEELVFKSVPSRSGQLDYYEDLLIEEVAAGLMEQFGYSYSQAVSKVYRGGFDIYSNENKSLQQKAEAIYADDSNFPAHIESDDEDPQGAIFVIDYDGHVVATVGGRGKKEGVRLFSRATDSRQQCGSSIKPLGSYGPAIMMNLVHFSSIVHNAPITLPNGTKWPPNYGQSVGDRGNVILAVALQRSLNTVAAQLLEKVTLNESYSFLTNRLHFDLPKEEMTYSGLALGGFEYGVTCREMAEGYQIYGSGGYYRKTSTFSRVEKDGEVILEAKYTPEQAMDESSAYVMNRLMQRVVRNGTGAGISGSWRDGWEVYAKTGTSGTSRSGTDRDVYFAGGTPQYVAASWFGYDYNKPLNSRQTGYAQQLWNKVMVAIRDNNFAEKAFTKKGDTVEAKFCTATGLLVGEGNTCPNTMIGVYKPDNMPGYCTEHGTAIGAPSTDPSGTTGTTTPTTAPVTIDLNEIYGRTTAPAA